MAKRLVIGVLSAFAIFFVLALGFYYLVPKQPSGTGTPPAVAK